MPDSREAISSGETLLPKRKPMRVSCRLPFAAMWEWKAEGRLTVEGDLLIRGGSRDGERLIIVLLSDLDTGGDVLIREMMCRQN